MTLGCRDGSKEGGLSRFQPPFSARLSSFWRSQRYCTICMLIFISLCQKIPLRCLNFKFILRLPYRGFACLTPLGANFALVELLPLPLLCNPKSVPAMWHNTYMSCKLNTLKKWSFCPLKASSCIFYSLLSLATHISSIVHASRYHIWRSHEAI